MTTTDPFTSAGPKAEDTREKNAKRDGKGRYLIPKLPPNWTSVMTTQDGSAKATKGVVASADTPWTRATTFAKSISDTFTLSAWSQRMVAKGLASRADLVLAAAACPVSDKGTLDNIVEQAKDAAAARASANLGTAMHNLTQDVDAGRLTDISGLPESAQRDLRAYAELLKAHGIEQIPGYSERTVVNDTFGIAGTFDRIVMYRGRPTVLDLKTGRDLQYGWNEIGIQLALYANADAIWDWDRSVFLPMPEDLDKATGLVIHLPVGRGVAELHSVSLTAAWAACQLCHDVRKWRSTRNLATLVSVAAPNTPGAIIAKAPSYAEGAAELSPGRSVPDATARNGHTHAENLAPLADPAKGEKGCSVCHRKGHRKGSPKCLGLDDPAISGSPEEPAPAVCHHVSGWTRDAVSGQYVCAKCGEPGKGAPVLPELEDVSDANARALGLDAEDVAAVAAMFGKSTREEDGLPDPAEPEEVADPFAEEPAPAAPVRPPTWVERIGAAASKGELRAIREEATKAGAWTPQLQAVGIARVAQISEDAG